MIPMPSSENLYEIADFTYNSLKPFSNYMNTISNFLDERKNKDLSFIHNNKNLRMMNRAVVANAILAKRFSQIYEKPEFGITETIVNGKTVPIEEKIIKEKPFCQLKHFKKKGISNQPKMLMVAPMAGHYATFLRGTVIDLLPHYDIYITEWKNAREVPLSQGSFDLSTYVQYLIYFMRELAPNLNVMGICQPGVPIMAAISIMETKKDPKIPNCVIMKGSPIDPRKGQTDVNKLASHKPEEWFQESVICIVPKSYPGAMRLVYPGFLQLGGFLSMNPDKHKQSIHTAMQNYIEGNFEDAEKVGSFYLEYFSVMDLTAEFYMQTIVSVFKEASLPRGELIILGDTVIPDNISKVAIMAVEGENDDICGLGQTKAALEITPNLSNDKKNYLMVKKAGHYGIFNGRKFRKIVLPEVLAFTEKHKTKK